MGDIPGGFGAGLGLERTRLTTARESRTAPSASLESGCHPAGARRATTNAPEIERGLTSLDDADIPDQTGRTFVITGANSGIGLEAARALRRPGAHVVLAVRDTARGATKRPTVHRRLDRGSLASTWRTSRPIRAFAADTRRAGRRAAQQRRRHGACPHGRTADGFERQIGTNHLGHFALTNLLLPRLTDRVVTQSSLMHKNGRIHRRATSTRTTAATAAGVPTPRRSWPTCSSRPSCSAGSTAADSPVRALPRIRGTPRRTCSPTPATRVRILR